MDFLAFYLLIGLGIAAFGYWTAGRFTTGTALDHFVKFMLLGLLWPLILYMIYRGPR